MVIQNIRLGRVLGAIFGGLSVALTAMPSFAAERVIFSYGLLELSIPVESLEAFAQEGHIDETLAIYAGEASSEELEEFRRLLQTPAEVSPVVLSQFLYSSLGEAVLQYLGDLIQTDSRLNGFYALRSAAVLAAADSEGLTLLNVVQHFPTPSVHINGVRALQVAEAFTQLITQTGQMITLIEQQATIEAEATPIDFAQFTDLQQPGTLNWQVETLQLHDQSRDRLFEADLYYPQLQTDPLPVVVISHGLGADNKSFADVAQHLASHGFAVAAIQHPGSDRQQMQNLFEGNMSEAVAPTEFIDIPKDVSFLLDELVRRNQTHLAASVSFDLQQVGVIGHSLGGYAALALAGAELNFDQLRAVCEFDGNGLNLANLSLPFQCIALDGENEQYPSLRDERVKAIFTMNPFTSSIFGPSGLQQVKVPTMLVAGSHDPLAPALLEQIHPFTWLPELDKYLMVIHGGTHIYASSDATIHEALAMPAELAGPDPDLARQYLKAKSLAFMQTHVAGQDEYRQYLNASYSAAISQPPLKLTLIQTLASANAELTD